MLKLSTMLFSGFILLFSNFVFAENISLNLISKNLKITGNFYSQVNKLLTISGFDLIGKPYKFEVMQKPKEKGTLQVIYKIDRDGKIESGSVITEKGKLAKMTSTLDDPEHTTTTFESTVSD
jgi:hypothetical protein